MAFQLFPSFSFDESNVGLRPVRTAALDRIGLVGVFSRGPVNPQIVGPKEAETLFGLDNAEGSAHLQAILDQGVTDLVISRVLALGAPQEGKMRVEGIATTSGSIQLSLQLDSEVALVEVPVLQGMSAAQVAEEIKNGAVLNGGAITASQDAEMITFKTRQNTNNLAIVNASLVDVEGVLLTSETGEVDLSTQELVLSGGADDPAPAQAVINNTQGDEMIRLEVIWPGSTGEGISATVAPGFEPGTMDLALSLANPEGGSQPLIREIYRGLSLTDLYDVDKLAALRGSSLVRAQIVASGTPETRSSLNPIVFSNASDGNPAGPRFEDYITALNKLESIQCTVLVVPGEKATLSASEKMALNEALITMAEKSDDEMGELNGLRIAVVSAPRGMAISDLAALKATNYIPNSKRTVMVAGWGTSARLPRFKRFGIDPSAVYAGHLVATPPQISPAARTSSPFIRGLTEVDTPIGNVAANEITKYRLDAIILDPVTGGLHMLNGRSTASDNAWYWICFRRVYDRIRMDIFFNFQFIKSEPSSRQMDVVIQDSINAYLDVKLQERLIAGYNPAVSNDSNNPAAIRAAGIRYVDFAIEPYFPNDFVQFNIARVLQASVRLA
jgi:hypothetical protein